MIIILGPVALALKHFLCAGNNRVTTFVPLTKLRLTIKVFYYYLDFSIIINIIIMHL